MVKTRDTYVRDKFKLTDNDQINTQIGILVDSGVCKGELSTAFNVLTWILLIGLAIAFLMVLIGLLSHAQTSTESNEKKKDEKRDKNNKFWKKIAIWYGGTYVVLILVTLGEGYRSTKYVRKIYVEKKLNL